VPVVVGEGSLAVARAVLAAGDVEIGVPGVDAGVQDGDVRVHGPTPVTGVHAVGVKVGVDPVHTERQGLGRSVDLAVLGDEGHAGVGAHGAKFTGWDLGGEALQRGPVGLGDLLDFVLLGEIARHLPGLPPVAGGPRAGVPATVVLEYHDVAARDGHAFRGLLRCRRTLGLCPILLRQHDPGAGEQGCRHHRKQDDRSPTHSRATFHLPVHNRAQSS